MVALVRKSVLLVGDRQDGEGFESRSSGGGCFVVGFLWWPWLSCGEDVWTMEDVWWRLGEPRDLKGRAPRRIT